MDFPLDFPFDFNDRCATGLVAGLAVADLAAGVEDFDVEDLDVADLVRLFGADLAFAGGEDLAGASCAIRPSAPTSRVTMMKRKRSV